MTVAPSQVQKVLRIYGRQLTRSHRSLQKRPHPHQEAVASVTISANASRLRTAADLIRNRDQEGNAGWIAKGAVARLSQEHGAALEVMADSYGGIGFAALDLDTGAVQRHLPETESYQLAERFAKIVVEMVDYLMTAEQEMP